MAKSSDRFADAEKAFDESVAIHRDLAARDPNAYRPDLADTLDSLGLLHVTTDRFSHVPGTVTLPARRPPDTLAVECARRWRRCHPLPLA